MSLPELGLRPFDEAEAQVVSAWMTDEATTVIWGGGNVRYPLDPAQWDEMRADPARSFWTPTLDGTLAGHFQLFDDKRRRLVRLGRVAIAPELRGRGLGTALARLACARAFGGDPDVHRIELHVYEHNHAARRAYERAGFVLEGVLRENLPVVSGGHTAVWSTAVMAILRREWVAGRG